MKSLVEQPILRNDNYIRWRWNSVKHTQAHTEFTDGKENPRVTSGELAWQLAEEKRTTKSHAEHDGVPAEDDLSLSSYFPTCSQEDFFSEGSLKTKGLINFFFVFYRSLGSSEKSHLTVI
jgi:hypothetical protein